MKPPPVVLGWFTQSVWQLSGAGASHGGAGYLKYKWQPAEWKVFRFSTWGQFITDMSLISLWRPCETTRNGFMTIPSLPLRHPSQINFSCLFAVFASIYWVMFCFLLDQDDEISLILLKISLLCFHTRCFGQRPQAKWRNVKWQERTQR